MQTNPLPPTTTAQENLTLESRRAINLIWEHTQAIIAVIVVLCTMAAGVYVTLTGRPETNIPGVLLVAFGTVVGFYFGRTNHSRPS